MEVKGFVFITTYGKFIKYFKTMGHTGDKHNYEEVESLQNATVFNNGYQGVSFHYQAASKLFGALHKVEASETRVVKLEV